MRPFALLAGLLPAALLAIVPLPGVAQAADPGLTGFADLLVDEAHDHLFLSEGTAGDRITVTDLTGTTVATIADLPGADQMVLDPDGSRLFVALPAADAIAAVDTTTLSVRRYPTGAGTCPGDIAVASGQVWFTTRCDGVRGSGLSALDPVDGSVATGLGEVTDGVLASDPRRADRLLVTTSLATPIGYRWVVRAYATAGGTAPSATAVATSREFQFEIPEIAIGDGGRSMAVIQPNDDFVAVLDADDLTDTAGSQFPSIHYHGGIAMRGDGMLATGLSTYLGGVGVADAGQPEFREYALPRTGYVSPPHSLAFGQTQLYAVTTDPKTGRFALSVVTPRHATDLIVSLDRKKYVEGQSVQVRVLLRGAPADSEVTVYAQPLGGEPGIIGSGAVNGNGVLTVTSTLERRTTISAEYAGDAANDPAIARRTVAVAARVEAVLRKASGQSGNYALYGADKSAILDATVTPDHAGDCLRFRWQYYRGGWTTADRTRCVALDSTSTARFRLLGDPAVVGVKFRMRAEWGGDADNGEAVSAWRYLRFVQ